MKQFRKRTHLPALLCAVLALTLCACEGEPDYTQVQLENSQGEEVLTLGMDRASVDALLSSQEGWDEREEGSLTFVDYHGGALGPITVWFQHDQAIYFSTGQDSFPSSGPVEDSPWQVKGIGLGSSRQAVMDSFGLPTQDSGTLGAPDTQFQVMQYKYLPDGTLLAADTEDEAFSVSFLLQEETVILFGVFSAGFSLHVDNDAATEEPSDQPLTLAFPAGYRLTIPAGCTYQPLQTLEGLRVLRDGQEICGLIYLPFEDPQRLSQEGFTHPDFAALLQPILGSSANSSDFVFSSTRYGSFMLELVLDQESTRHHFFPANQCFYDLWVLDGALTPEEENSFLNSFYWEEA